MTDTPFGDVVVVLASAGRPELLAAAMREVDALQGAGIDKLLSVPDAASLPAGATERADWRRVVGTRGLAAQRNAALDAIAAADPAGPPAARIVVFFDDDAVIRPDYVATARKFLAAHPEVAGLTGRVLQDGAVTGEIPEDAAHDAVAASAQQPPRRTWRRRRELYGCNFAVRVAAAPALRFDARLPLYSWLEDHDFARRLMRHGVLAQVDDCVIVHRAAASGGRHAHERLGYSQMMNPVYLWRKGSFPAWLMVNEAGRRVAKNLVRSVGGPEAEWRRRRLRGNALAALDVLRGRLTPERITEL